ncbi:MAG: VWA domain-containing protein [Candidatus Gracilibacteria bacterium]|nr:VWA domain-containing protein [Candidatus Gracilibacteria bacterium]
MEIFNIHFLNPIFLYVLPFVLVLFLVLNYYENKKNSIEVGFYSDLKKVYKFSSLYYYVKLFLIILILGVFFILFADPQRVGVDEKIKKNGIDIVMVLDVSKSMEASDLNPTRIESAKKVIISFLDKMSSDRVGLIVFAGKPFSSVPLTYDYDILKESVRMLTTDSINQNVSGLSGTAVGDAMLSAKALFNLEKEESKSREKIVLLLTDGDANVGVDPILVSKLLAKEGIKVYTVGIGSKEGGYINYQVGPFTQKQQVPPLNEAYLKEISSTTSGEFFRATDNATLTNIFSYLEKLEKNDIEINIKKTYSENYKPFLYVLLVLFFLLFILEVNYFRK